MYQALYRKYRPRVFYDVTGQEHVTETLRRQILTGRIAHAYLFVGTRGTGKTTCAKILSRAVNCTAPVDGNPCNECPSCIGIENGSILDVLEIDAASNSGVDNVRALREEAVYSPASVNKRVYIIDEVHMLSTAAFNALLKILEEPPEHLLFILATTELHKVPATILSRCQRFSFKRLSADAIAGRLQSIAANEGLTLTDDAAERLAGLAEGSMRDGISLFDQCASETVVDLQRVLDTIGLTGHRELLQLASSIANRDTAGALGVLSDLYDDGKDMHAIQSELAALWRDLLVFMLSKDAPLLSGSFSRAELSALAGGFSPERLLYFLEIIRKSIIDLSRGGSAKLSAEMGIIMMCDERLSDDTTALLSRVKNLEERAESEMKPEGPATRRPGPASVGAAGAAGRTAAVAAADHEPQTPDSELRNPNSGFPLESSADPKLTVPDTELPAPDNELPAPDSEPAMKAESGDFWRDILDHIKSNASVYAVLNDSEKVRAELRDQVLYITAGDSFTSGSINSKRFSEPLREAAGKVFGREVIIRVETIGAQDEPGAGDKLKELRRFPIVKYE